MKSFGDIYVVKDCPYSCFIEFQYFDKESDETPCNNLEEVRMWVEKLNPFGSKFEGVWCYKDSLLVR